MGTAARCAAVSMVWPINGSGECESRASAIWMTIGVSAASAAAIAPTTISILPTVNEPRARDSAAAAFRRFFILEIGITASSFLRKTCVPAGEDQSAVCSLILWCDRYVRYLSGRGPAVTTLRKSASSAYFSSVTRPNLEWSANKKESMFFATMEALS